jgi:hypothetical protein
MTCGHAAYLLIGFVPESGSFCPIAVFFSLLFSRLQQFLLAEFALNRSKIVFRRTSPGYEHQDAQTIFQPN